MFGGLPKMNPCLHSQEHPNVSVKGELKCSVQFAQLRNGLYNKATSTLTVWDPKRIQNSSKQNSLVTIWLNLLTLQKGNWAEGTLLVSHPVGLFSVFFDRFSCCKKKKKKDFRCCLRKGSDWVDPLDQVLPLTVGDDIRVKMSPFFLGLY